MPVNLLRTSLGPIRMCKAREDELLVVMDVLNQAAAWLKRQGILQWPVPMPQSVQDYMAAGIQRGDTYLGWLDPRDARSGEKRQAVVTLRFESYDEYLWPLDPSGGLYLHSLAVSELAHGHRVGAAVLEWALRQAAAAGRDCLRLDCLASNQRLCRYYINQGFIARGPVTFMGYRAMRFEKKAGG